MRTILLLLLIFGCSGKDEVYFVKGTIYDIDSTKNSILIAHDTIADLMMPMVMPFTIGKNTELNSLNIGDSVHFQFVWNNRFPFARKFKIVGKGNLPDTDEFFDNIYTEKNIGQIIDDVTLLLMTGGEVKLSDSDGRYRFISYIFSRCPMPNLCPAIVIKNKALSDRFPDIDFIMVSFDYKYDTPKILYDYYYDIVSEKDNLNVWSSTGYIEQIYQLVKQSGGDFWGVEDNKIGHTLKSIFIGPQRNLLASWSGEEWTVLHAERVIEMLVDKKE